MVPAQYRHDEWDTGGSVSLYQAFHWHPERHWTACLIRPFLRDVPRSSSSSMSNPVFHVLVAGFGTGQTLHTSDATVGAYTLGFARESNDDGDVSGSMVIYVSNMLEKGVWSLYGHVI